MKISSVGYLFHTNQIEFIFQNGSFKTEISKFKKLRKLNHQQLVNYKIKEDFIEWDNVKIHKEDIIDLLIKTLDENSELIKNIPIGEITAVSNEHTKFLRDLCIPFSFTPVLSEEIIHIALELNLPLIRKVRNHYECVANTRVFEFAKNSLPKDIAIPVKIIKRANKPTLDKYYFYDAFISYLVHNLNEQRYSYFFKLWKQLQMNCKNESINNSIELPYSKRGFSRTMNIPKGKLK